MITKVSQDVYRGPMPDFVEMKNLGIKTIVGLQNGGDNEELSACIAAGIRYYDFDLPGLFAPDVKTLKLIVSVISSSFKPVYVHCRHGRERTGLVIAAYLIETEFWSEKYIQEMIDRGSRWPYSWFAKRLLRKMVGSR